LLAESKTVKKRIKTKKEKRTDHALRARKHREKIRARQSALVVFTEDSAWVLAEAKRLGITSDVFKDALRVLLDRYRKHVPDSLPAIAAPSNAGGDVKSRVISSTTIQEYGVAHAGTHESTPGPAPFREEPISVTRDIVLGGKEEVRSPAEVFSDVRSKMDPAGERGLGSPAAASSGSEIAQVPPDISSAALASLNWEPFNDDAAEIALDDATLWIRFSKTGQLIPSVDHLCAITKAESASLRSDGLFQLTFSNQRLARKPLALLLSGMLSVT
jgi:hypothetical protein